MPDSVPMIRMSDVQQTAVHWLWYPYIPFGKLTILQGNPGEGKTYFAMYQHGRTNDTVIIGIRFGKTGIRLGKVDIQAGI